MNEFKKEVLKKHIDKTLENLKKNNMQPFYVETKEEALVLAKTLIKEGDTVSAGGSTTLDEIGIRNYLRAGENFNFLDRSKAGITREEAEKLERLTFSSDVFFASSNAITEEGELYNVDGYGNRVSAMIFGPKSVVLVVGYNKIVKDRDEAIKRVEEIAAPANAVRLNCKTPCAKTGSCMKCKTDARICCSYVFLSQQRIKDRIKVIIVGEVLGY